MTIFDAIPEFWKAWTPDVRKRMFIPSINLLPGAFLTSMFLVAKCHLMELTKFVPLDKMNQVRVAYWASKRDPSLITMIDIDVHAQAEEAEVTDNNQRTKERELLSFQMMPKMLLDPAIQKYPPYQQAQEKLLRHIIQYSNRSSWKE